LKINSAQLGVVLRQFQILLLGFRKKKEARDENSNGSHFGTLFLGPLVGTFVGNPIDDKSDHKNKKDDLQSVIAQKNEEITQLQTELAEATNSNSGPDLSSFLGDDEGSEFQEEANVNKTTTKKLTPNNAFSLDND
jgi:hypothetical protein